MSKGFSKSQLDKLRSSYSSIKRIDPTSAMGKKFTDFIHNRSDDELRSLQDAGINFVSVLSRVELGRRKSKVKEDLDLEEYLDEAKQLSFHQAKRYAVNNIKDSDSAIEIWKHKNGGHDINKAKNSVGAKWLKNIGAKKVHVVTKENVEEPVNEVSAALKMRYVRAAERDVAVRSIRAASHLKKTASSQNVLDVRDAQKKYNKEIDKSNNRTRKVDNVARKLTNESTDSIDDLSQNGTFDELKVALHKMNNEERNEVLKHVDKKFWDILGVNEMKTYDSGWKPAKGTVTDKSGAKHDPMSRTQHLARLGRDRADAEIPPFKGGHKVSDENPKKHVKRLAKMGLKTVTKEAAAPAVAPMMPTGSKYDHTCHDGKSKAKALILAISDKKKEDVKLKKESVEMVTEVRHPLAGHDYHTKTDMQLAYIRKDAGEAKRAMSGGHNPKAENKYADQVNDAVTVSHFRRQFKGGKMPGWYARKYGHKIAEETVNEATPYTKNNNRKKIPAEMRERERLAKIKFDDWTKEDEMSARKLKVAPPTNRSGKKIFWPSFFKEATFSANIKDADYQKIRSASMRGNFTHKFTRKTNGDTRFSTSSPKKLASDLQKLIDAGENSWDEILGIDAAEIKSKGKTKQTHFHMESRELPSADKKPEEYIDVNGEKKVRMVPVKRKVAESAVPVVKGDTIRMTHKTSGKTIVINSKAQRKYESMGYVLKEGTVAETKIPKYKVDTFGRAIFDTKTSSAIMKYTANKIAKQVETDRADRKALWTPVKGKLPRKTMKKESFEGLDELSKPLLKRYISKATKSEKDARTTADNVIKSMAILGPKGNGKAKVIQNDKIADKRQKGIAAAYSKMKEEAESLDELHPAGFALGDYKPKKGETMDHDDQHGRSRHSTITKVKKKFFGLGGIKSMRIKNHKDGEAKYKYDKTTNLYSKESFDTLDENSKLAQQLADRKAQRQRMKDRKAASAVKKVAVASGQKPAIKPTVDKGKNAMDDRHIIMQLRSAQDLDGNKEIRFRRGTGKLDINTINTILKVHDKFTKPNDKRRLFIAVSKSADDAKKTADKFKHIKF